MLLNRILLLSLFIAPIFSVEFIYPLKKDKTWDYKIGRPPFLIRLLTQKLSMANPGTEPLNLVLNTGYAIESMVST